MITRKIIKYQSVDFNNLLYNSIEILHLYPLHTPYPE